MMFGGLKKSASRAALVAAATVLSTSAFAADLGGDCCADLEERVAELEATTARKGTRKVSLTISGQINRTIVSYNDGGSSVGTGLPGGNRTSNTFFGVDNTNSSSRFNFTGDAKISPALKAGYNITVEIASGARSATVTQAKGEVAAVATTSPGYSQFGLNDQALAVRDAVVWLEHSAVGRVSLGRMTPTGPQGTIDLGGIGVIAPSTSLLGSSLAYRNSNTNALVASIGAGYDANGNLNNRSDGIRYDSPSFGGFQIGLTMAEASNTVTFVPAVADTGPVAGALGSGNGDLGRVYAANLRYAGEFSGVRLAAAIGYERNQEDSQSTFPGVDKKHLGGSLSALHVPTGLFLQGSYTKISSQNEGETVRNGAVWHIAGGISQNFFGVGKTNLYGEYGAGQDMFWVHRTATYASQKGDDSRFWGLGIVQNFDAAALELYAGYRNYSADLQGNNPPATVIPTRSIDVVGAGARIKF
jgi:hypothetical protein